MKHLNNKNGWGISTEIIFIFLFICLLLYAIFYINKMGLLNNPNMEKNDNTAEVDNKDDKQKDTTYEDIEADLKAAARLYIKKEYGYIGHDTLVISSRKLLELGYIDSIKDPDNSDKVCSGYVEVEDNGEVIYKPYINCSKYHTDGYVKRKDI